MFSKLSKKYGLSDLYIENACLFYNEHCEKFYCSYNNPNIEKVRRIYISDQSLDEKKDFYKILFEEKKDIKGYNFFILKIDNSNEIKDFIHEIIEEAIILEYLNYLIVLYKNELEIDPSILSSNLNEDFYMNVEVFEGFKIESNKDLISTFILYRYYLRGKPIGNLRDLIMSIVNKYAKDLIILKPIVLKKLNNDSQIEKLINGMFDNNLNVSKTSNSVYMHRNTINNKLEVIKEETSLDVQNFKDAMALYFLMNAK